MKIKCFDPYFKRQWCWQRLNHLYRQKFNLPPDDPHWNQDQSSQGTFDWCMDWLERVEQECIRAIDEGCKGNWYNERTLNWVQGEYVRAQLILSPDFGGPRITDMSEMFKDCNTLQTIDWSEIKFNK